MSDPQAASGAGWHPDPSGRHELRYWDGSGWTASVSDQGRQGTDAEGAAPGAGQAASSQSPAAFPSSGLAGGTSSAAYPPAVLAIQPADTVTNWRAIVNPIMAIPHMIVLYVLGAVSGICAVISWFMILFTGEANESIVNLQAMFLRYTARTMAFATFLHEDYPPFEFEMQLADTGTDPHVRVDLQPATGERDKLSVGLRYFYVLPHAIVLGVLGIAAYVCIIIGFFTVLITGKWSEGPRDFLIKVFKWALRVQAYYLLLTDEYPPFAFVD